MRTVKAGGCKQKVNEIHEACGVIPVTEVTMAWWKDTSPAGNKIRTCHLGGWGQVSSGSTPPSGKKLRRLLAPAARR